MQLYTIYYYITDLAEVKLVESKKSISNSYQNIPFSSREIISWKRGYKMVLSTELYSNSEKSKCLQFSGVVFIHFGDF